MRMSGRIIGTEHIRDKRDSHQEGSVGSEPQGDACGSRGRSSRPWISPGRVRARPGHAGTRCHPPAPPGGAAHGAARDEPKPLRGGGVGCPIPRPPHPLGTSSPGFQRHRARGAGLGMGVEVGMGRLSFSCAPRLSAEAESARGKAAERRGETVAPPRGDAEPSLTSGAVGSGEGRCQGLSLG